MYRATKMAITFIWLKVVTWLSSLRPKAKWTRWREESSSGKGAYNVTCIMGGNQLSMVNVCIFLLCLRCFICQISPCIHLCFFAFDFSCCALMSAHAYTPRSLLKNTPRNATCKALEDVVCLTLDRANFNAILGPLDALKKVPLLCILPLRIRTSPIHIRHRVLTWCYSAVSLYVVWCKT